MEDKKCWWCGIVAVLSAIGAINWLLVALFNFDLVAALLGTMTIAAKVVYTLVGISGILLLASLVKSCGCQKPKA